MQNKQPLFAYLDSAFGSTALDSEMHEIELLCHDVPALAVYLRNALGIRPSWAQLQIIRTIVRDNQ